MRRRLFSLLLGLGASALLRGDTLIVSAGGFVGAWDTEIEMANVSADPVDVTLSIVGLPLGLPCPPNCTSQTLTVPGHGTQRVLASAFLGSVYQGPQMIRVDTAAGVPAPSVHARSVSAASETQFAELPVVRLSTIEALDTTVLVFPGASRQEGVYSNLILEGIGGSFVGGSLVTVELFDGSGESLASRTFSITGEATLQATTIQDVVGRLGVTELEDGQIRVTRLTGTGSLWGVMTNVLQSGALKVKLGANP
ncbi:MAG TPA: hypothetical protein VGK26_11260 [Thermoanaerobaculia bacterium]|jgi:hypothetical protein